MPTTSAGYVGDYAEDYATLNFKFSTFTTAWVPVALAGTPIISVYTGSATGTEVTTGVTLAVDFDGVTGLNNILIDLSSAAFYAVGADFHVIITQGTIDSVSAVGTVVGSFSIENRKSKADVVEWLGTAVAAATAGVPNVNTIEFGGVTNSAATGSGEINVNVEEINASNNAASVLGQWLQHGLSSTTDSGTTTTFIDTILNQTDDIWNGALLIFFSGSNTKAAFVVTDFDAASDTITFAPAAPNAVTTDGYVLIPGLGRAGVEAWLGSVPDSLTATGEVKTDIQQINGNTLAANVLGGWMAEGIQGASDSGTTTTLRDAALTEVDDYWNGALLIITSGTNNGFTAVITDFDAASDTLTFTPAFPNGITTESYTIIPGLGRTDIPAILTTQMTESYAANGVAPTMAQIMFAVHQMLMQFGISGTALTVRQLDDSTTAFVVTLDDGTSPTDAKRV